QGVARNVGAISESLGEYGGETVLATPIESILGISPDGPGDQAQPVAKRTSGRAARRKVTRDRALMARARPIATPLTVTGLGDTLGHALERAGRRVGRPLLAAPAGPLGSFPPQT